MPTTLQLAQPKSTALREDHRHRSGTIPQTIQHATCADG
jgi:hypothetical protein